jgi:hypothetical protein
LKKGFSDSLFQCSITLEFLNDYTMQLHVQRNQQEKKLKMLPHLLFYRNVFLSLILHICILAIHSNFIDCLPIEKSIIN